MRSEIYDGGAYCRTTFQAINRTATAGGTGDATEVDGAWIDRHPGDASDLVGPFMSAKLVITFTAALDEGETLSFGVQFQDATSLAGAGADDYGDAVAAAVAATGNSGGSTEVGTFEVDINLSGAERFIRAQITPDLSRNGTDTAEWSAILVLFGSNRVPSTLAVAKVADDEA